MFSVLDLRRRLLLGDARDGWSPAIKESEPAGITVTPNGDPWFAEMAASKIAVLQLK